MPNQKGRKPVGAAGESPEPQNRQTRASGRAKKAAASQNGNAPKTENNQNNQKKAVQTGRGGNAPQTQTEGSQKKAPQTGRSQRGRIAAAKNAAAQPVEVQNPQAGAPTRARRARASSRSKGKSPVVRIVSLGGLGEVGKNLTVFECEGEAFIVDCGLTFPDESMPGVDLVIPDFTYVLENKDKIKGIFITHGHEDHIGALPYLLKQVKFPLYGTKLTLALVEGKLKEHGLLGKVQLNVKKPGDVVELEKHKIEFINVNHSIPDACAFALHTPAGVIVHTGDFKVDYTPIGGQVINLARFGELGSKGVLCLLSDSTNSERAGSTSSERTVGVSFDKLFAQAASQRIIVATFASNVHRIQQIIDAAVKTKRKIAVSGRSMENVLNKALEIGYVDIPSGVLVDVSDVRKYPPEKVVIITTGSQGEPMSALTRMAMGDHRQVTVGAGDCIIISATPIPGNEKLVTKVINELLKLGANVVYEKMFDIHVSGHACQDEQKMMLALTKPKFFMPVHGEFKHLKKHSELAASMGIDPKNVVISEIGRVVELSADSIKLGGTVPAGKVLVDGLGVGDVGSIVLRDRKHLAQDGLIVVVTTVDSQTGQILSGPDIVSRGFVYVRESEDMIGRARNIARESIQKCMDNNNREWGVLKQRIRDDVGDYLWQMTKRSPMILPVIQEVMD